MTLPHEETVTADKVFQLANEELRNVDPQTTPQDQEEQRVPYSRFKEVNDERRQLLDLVQNFQALQQQQTQMQQQAQPTVTPQQPTGPAPLFTDDELASFETDIVLDPKATLAKFGQAIMERGVNAKVSEVEQRFQQQLAQMQQGIAQQTLPTVLDNFKRQRFHPSQGAEVAAFDEAVKTMDPTLLTNPSALENIRLAAIGYVADQRMQNPTQQLPFSESPSGGLPGGWGGLGGGSQPTVPPQVMALAQKMGIDPKEAASMYKAMDTSGVFR